MDNYENIIKTARELATMIEKHESTVKYRESLASMKNDVTAQNLLARLVKLGEEISTTENPEEGESTGPAERELIGKELESNELVKSHIMVQKEYLDLIAKIQDKIKNPT